jgi:cell division protein ZapA (FtsZ GTPase activity inhibitor)
MDNDDQDRELRERIASLVRAAERVPTVPVPDEELQRLKAAAIRLDEMLKEAAEADVQVLKSAAARLDQMLAKIGKRKDVTGDLKRRDGSQRR